MKILSRMLSKKIDPQAAHELDEDGRPLLDDAGQVRSRDMFADDAAPVTAHEEEPEVAGSGWAQSDDWDDDWDDDEDWGAEDDPSIDMEERRRTADKQHLVSEIREAMVSVSHVTPDADPEQVELPGAAGDGTDFSDDDQFGRRARARSQLELAADDEKDRLLEKTEDAMSDRETSRRRSALAHMKAAAAATKADRVLRHVASQDPSGDPSEQSPYRDDLAKVVRPHATSRPISRQVTRPNAPSPVWDQGTADPDAALFAAAEDGLQEDPALSVEEDLAAAESERLARVPEALSAQDFAESIDDGQDGFAEDVDFDDDDDELGDVPDYSARLATRSEFPASRFADVEDAEEDALDRNAFGDIEEEDLDRPSEDDAPDFDEDDEFAPRPSSAVSEAIAYATAPDEKEDIQPEAEVRKKIWEMADEVAAEVATTRQEAEELHMDAPEEPAEPPVEPLENLAEVSSAVIAGRAGRSAGRVKTRLLGFQAEEQAQDVFAAAADNAKAVQPSTAEMFPSGWIVVIDGPGRGASFTLQNGVSQIGRGEEQTVRLDFGDTSISRNNHAAVAYDDETGKFYLGHGGKSNLVRLNGKPVLSTEEMSDGDEIRIGETSLKFIALCGDEFTWSGNGDNGEDA